MIYKIIVNGFEIGGQEAAEPFSALDTLEQLVGSGVVRYYPVGSDECIMVDWAKVTAAMVTPDAQPNPSGAG